ncbi:integrase core domain-containing protein [Dyella agri]|uniref:Transposase n=1 Tax=Dyella agri TaxID=1926869 RepID=A0ABW8KKQ3_9GAMM
MGSELMPFLDRYVFTSLYEVRRMTEDWRQRYNYQRPTTPSCTRRTLARRLRHGIIRKFYFYAIWKNEDASPI